jgi:hypothetical protein
LQAQVTPTNKSVSKEQRILDSFFKQDQQLPTPKIMPAVLQQQLDYQMPPRQDRAKTILRKVSKVSILSTTRRIDDMKVLTSEKIIPLKQHTTVGLETNKFNSH